MTKEEFEKGKKKILETLETLKSLNEDDGDKVTPLFISIVENKESCTLLSLMILSMLEGAEDFLDQVENTLDEEEVQAALNECERIALVLRSDDKIGMLENYMNAVD